VKSSQNNATNFVQSGTASRPEKLVPGVISINEPTLNCSSAECQHNPQQGRRRTVFIVMEIFQERKQAVFVPTQDTSNLRRFVRIGHEYLGKRCLRA
jgi:hypothetical protein